VTPKYRQRGCGTKIVNAAIDSVRNFEIDPVYIKVEGSSNFSKKIFERAGMEILHEKNFDDWEVEGRKPFQNTGIHKSLKNYGLKLSAK
jgi:RimJ/RimL family protein N-acetyltransferase